MAGTRLDLRRFSKKLDVQRSVLCNIFLYYNQQDASVSQIIYSCKNALHVSDGLSVHHQEVKTAHTATGI